MPVRDHFHPPLRSRRRWTSFHGAWATCISFQLNRMLPPEFFAEPVCTFVVEIDGATFDEDGQGSAASGWAPPAPALTVPIAAATDSVEVRVYSQLEGPALVGCIELVSPSNKDRPAEREAFVSKCASYLHDGVGLIVVDIVTNRLSNMHAALLERVALSPVNVLRSELYTTAYRPVRHEGKADLHVWQEPLAVGQPLPTMPLWLRDGPCLPVDLEAAYEQTCRELRLQSNGSSATG